MAIADAPATDTPAADGAAPAEGTKAKKNRKPRNAISVPTTPELRAKLDETAKAESKSVRQIVAERLAASFGVAAPAPRTRTQYETPEAKKEASKARRQTKAALLKMLMDKHAGELDTLKAEAEAVVKAKTEEQAAAEAAAANAPAGEAAVTA